MIAVRGRRRIALVVGMALLALFAWLAVRVYRGRVDPEAFSDDTGPLGAVFGPPAPALTDAAERHLEHGLEILGDRGEGPAARIEAYRRELRTAERLLVRSLRAQPGQASALAKLAAVRFELDPPATAIERRRLLDLVEEASRLAPADAEVQETLGTLATRMQTPEEALVCFRRAVGLDPGRAHAIVETLAQSGMGLDAIRAGLPDLCEVLIASRPLYFEAGRREEYLAALERRLGGGDPAILAAYAEACIAAEAPERLVATLTDRLSHAEPAVEGEILLRRSAGLLALARRAEALSDAERAARLRPDDPAAARNEAEVAAAAGDPERAVRAYQDLLRIAAKASWDARARAWIHREIGQLEERLFRPDQAYDSYMKALDLDPADRFSRERLEEMKKPLAPAVARP